MTRTSALKTITISLAAIALASGTALAGNGEDCDHKKKAAAKAQSTTSQTAVMGATTTAATADYTAKKAMKSTYTFDEAVALCREKGVTDLQACVDKKTGVVKPKS